MRSSLLLAAAASAVVAQPHHHAHQHSHMHHNHAVEKRALVEQVVTVTVLECVLEGRQLSEAECNEGVRNGTLRFTDGDSAEVNKVATNLIVPQATPAPAVHAEVQPTEAALPAPPAPVAPVAPAPEVAAAPPPPPPAAVEVKPAEVKPAVVVPQNNRAAESFGASAGGASAAFPSGQLGCDEFPSAYGAVAADWLNIGGWLSVQRPGSLVKRGFSNIMTVVPNMCPNGNCCLEGSYCSYACPNGYFKAQWPSMQGSTGQSVGGLLCQNGKLVLTNPQTNKLCVPGTKQVSAFVKNTMSQTVSICQTNYPGDEAMTIPIVVGPGQTVELPIIDSPNYWHTWENKPISAQYYLNPAGVSHQQACKWNGKNTGNWAPMNIGAGWNGNNAYLSIFGNYPTQQSELLDYKIQFEGDMSLKCKYENGQICRGANYETCNSPLQQGSGCTTALNSGDKMTLILSN